MASRIVALVSAGLFLVAVGAALPFAVAPWLTAPMAAGIAVMAGGTFLTFVGYRAHRAREERVDRDERSRRVEGRAALSTLTVGVPVAGLVVSLLGLTTLDPPAVAVMGPFFALLAGLWVGFRWWYGRHLGPGGGE